MSQLITQEAERQALCQKMQLNAHKTGLWVFTGTCFCGFFVYKKQ